MRMHDGQVEVTVDAVARGIEEQVPELAGLPIERIASAGTVIAPFRVGDAFVARVPLVPSADAATRVRLRAEADHALFLTGRLPVEVPRPIALGEPWADYPGCWSLWTWTFGTSLDRLLDAVGDASTGSANGPSTSSGSGGQVGFGTSTGAASGPSTGAASGPWTGFGSGGWAGLDPRSGSAISPSTSSGCDLSTSPEVPLAEPVEAPWVVPTELPTDLARLLQSFHRLPTDGRTWNGAGRGGRPLADSDHVREAIARSAHLVDPAIATAIWDRALSAPPHAGPPSVIHGDPMPGNLIMRDGRLAALIDISEPVVGDPAADLQPAWVIFDGPTRARFLDAMDADAAARERGRGWAFQMAIGGLHYYEHTNQTFFEMARRTLARLLETA